MRCGAVDGGRRRPDSAARHAPACRLPPGPWLLGHFGQGGVVPQGIALLNSISIRVGSGDNVVELEGVVAFAGR